MAEVAPIILLDAVRRERETRAAEKSLIEFTKQAFSIIEPGVTFVDNWHLHAIAEHLEAVSDGEIDNLVINIPPGCMKSILVSVAWPAWEWIEDPKLRYMGASYGSDLSIRDSMKCRDIVLSEWYQHRWPQVQIKAGSDQKTKYDLVSGGWRMATSTGGRATGEHPDRKIVDDPLTASQADSDAERESANVWFDRTLSTRGESRGARTVVVMQRLHEKDITGHILTDLAGYEHLCLPMEYDGRRSVTCIGWEDPRTTEGSLLWPEMFPADKLKKLKRLLGEYGTSGQLQQRPSPAGGGILKVSHFQRWPAKDELPAFDYIVQSLDCAFSEKTTNDPTAFGAFGVFSHKGKRGVMLLDCWSEHLGYPDLRAKVLDEWHSVYGKTGQRKGKKADAVLIEAKASGQSLIQDLRQANIPAIPYNPGNADKVNRAHQASPILELDCIWIPESAKNPGEFVTWARPFISQLERFPNDEHDDFCFVGNTKIRKADGLGIDIMHLSPGDFVDTPSGPCRVLSAGCSNPSAEVLEVRLSNGISLVGTKDHPVYIPALAAFVALGQLIEGDELCVSSRLFDTEELITADIRIVRALPYLDIFMGSVKERMKRCIGLFGQTITGRYQRVSKCITKTATLRTTRLKILNALRRLNMEKGIRKTTLHQEQYTLENGTRKTKSQRKRLSLASSHAQDAAKSLLRFKQTGLSFVQQSAAICSIPAEKKSIAAPFAEFCFFPLRWLSPVRQSAGKSIAADESRKGTQSGTCQEIKNNIKSNAENVESHSLQKSIWRATVPPLAALQKSETTRVLWVKRKTKREPVYAVKVEGNPVFFANGVLVHNCDIFSQCMIYLRDSGWLEMPQAAEDEPEEVDYYNKKRNSFNPYSA